ncbi:MAG: nucleotidyl transferase AbiEii/AbiGii toxin family protein [Saprospiraceae bacterium]
MLQRKTIEPGTLELLVELCSLSELNSFVLVGGTSLALQLGHRKSIDLDFFTNHDFSPDDLISLLSQKYSLQVLQKTNKSLICNINHVKVDFIFFAYPFQHPKITQDGIRLLAIEDIAPLKLDAISGRGSKKDFFDLYFLLKLYSLQELLNFYIELYPHQTTFHVLRSMVYFKDAENDPDPVLIDSTLTWDIIKLKIMEEIKLI